MPDPVPDKARRPLVVVRLRGGLGNQMFQYAIGRCISLTQNRELLLDQSPLSLDIAGTTKRRYALGIFSLKVRSLRDWRSETVAASPIEAYLVERSCGFFPEALQPNPFPTVCLQGFWQNERYFLPIQDVIRQDFELQSGPWEDCPYRAQIAETPAPVGVHVRRTDYLTAAGSHLGFLGVDYYRRAAEEILREVKDPRFFIFSDDAEWCAEHLRLEAPFSIVQHKCNEDTTAVDFALMRMCRHFIIANSSFSWWAAWLAANEDKVVIAPAPWFQSGQPGSEIVPAGWRRVATQQVRAALRGEPAI